MTKNTLKWGLIALALVVIVAGSGSLVMASRPTASQAAPAQVVERFYAWYLAYPGEPGQAPKRNALVDRAYTDRPELAPAFIEKVDGILASFDKGGYDPFLCAQDLPQRISPGEVAVQGSTATVTMDLTWAGNAMVSHFDVVLAQNGQSWQIVDVRCGAAPTAMAPEQVVRAFYDLYLGSAAQGSLLGRGSYRDMPYLSPEFIEKVERLVASFDKGGYDPFLCAQDVPGEVAVDQAVVSGDQASVVVKSTFPGHSLTVKLERRAGQWWIVDIVCRA